MNIFSLIKEWFHPLPKGIANTKVSTINNDDYVLYDGESFPTKFFNEILFIPVKNQENIGSCHSHSVCMMYEYELYKKDTVYVEMSELFHYYVVRQFINKNYPQDKGQTIIDGIKCAYKYGMCPEKLSPYKIENYNKEPDFIQDDFASFMMKKYPVTLYYRLITVDDIKRVISNNKLVCCGLKVDYNFLKRQYTWTPGGTYKGGHSVVIYGYDSTYFYFRNSWGERYGRNGNFRVLIEDVMSEGFDFMSFDIQ